MEVHTPRFQSRRSPDSRSVAGGGRKHVRYDLIGNRLSSKQGNAAAESYRYNNQANTPLFPSDPNYASKSHRLNGFGSSDSRSYDATGNLSYSSDMQRQLSYNARGELTDTSADVCAVGAKICFGATRYSYNASGERVSKETPYSYNIFVTTDGAQPEAGSSTERPALPNRNESYALFDEAGQILVDQTINVTQYPCGRCRDPYVEYIYLDGMPIAALNDPNGFNGLTVTELYDDHLGTPRLANDAGTQSWSWANLSGNSASGGGNSFGTQANIGLGINLRFPGQQYDWQTGLNYNYMRFYEPRTGRYITSDPIGLAGGMNTYLYANGNPLMFADPLGLWVPPALPQGFVDVVAGVGDTVSFGLSKRIRDDYDIEGADFCSGAYRAGRLAGIPLSVATFAAGGMAINIGIRSFGFAKTRRFQSRSATPSFNVQASINAGRIST